MMPFESIVIPLYTLMRTLNWTDTYAALILPEVAGGLIIFLFRQFFAGIPKEIYEAARIDGASWWRIYLQMTHAAVRPDHRDRLADDVHPPMGCVLLAAGGGQQRRPRGGSGRDRAQHDAGAGELGRAVRLRVDRRDRGGDSVLHPAAVLCARGRGAGGQSSEDTWAVSSSPAASTWTSSPARRGFRRVGETVRGQRRAFFPGGKGANQAVAAAKSGAPTALIGRVGQDAFGQRAEGVSAGQGVDLKHVADDERRSTGMALITVCDADNTIVVVPGANGLVTPADVGAPAIAGRRCSGQPVRDSACDDRSLLRARPRRGRAHDPQSGAGRDVRSRAARPGRYPGAERNRARRPRPAPK